VPDTIRNFHRGRLAAWLWRPAVADSAFSAYLASGGSPERAKLELARVRLALGAPGTDTLYYQVAASADPPIVRDLRADLAFVADTEQLREFDRAGAAARPQWLRQFWEQRDLESLHPRGSRLREHYRRIGVARQKFRILNYPRQYELNELWVNRDAEYDDRGLIFIRHGPPDATAGATRAGGCPNTSWLYRRAEGNLIFHFVARQHPDDWRLVETLANLAGESGATTRLRQAGSQQSCGALDGLLESRVALDPIYIELSSNGTRRNWERELALTTKSREIGTTTDSDLLHYPTSLGLAWRAYGLLGDSAGKGRAVVLISVPANTLKPISLEPLAYGFQMRLVARSGSRATELDTTRLLGVHQAPQAGQMVTFTTDVPLPAGAWSVGVALEQQHDSGGDVLRDPEVPIPDISGKTLALSDIVLGDATGGKPWAAPDGPFPLSASGSFVRGEPVPIYYELVGARPGSEVKSEITLVREDGKGRSVIGFSERVDGAVRRVRREVNTSKSEPGRYTMTVKVTTDGKAAQRQTSLLVVQKEGGK